MVVRFEEKRARTQGITKTAQATDPAPMLVKRKPSSEASRCNTFNATTGIRAGISEIKNAKRTLRATTIWMPGVYRTYRIAASRDSKKLSSGRFDAIFGFQR